MSPFIPPRYVEMNPVAAGMVALPEEYRWSSAAAHLAGEDDQLVKVKPLLDIVSDWQGFLSLTDEEELTLLRKHERSGRPLGGRTGALSPTGEEGTET